MIVHEICLLPLLDLCSQNGKIPLVALCLFFKFFIYFINNQQHNTLQFPPRNYRILLRESQYT